MLEFLLPRNDTGVTIQIVASAMLLPASLLVLIRTGRKDAAWLVAGIVTIWIAFAALRTLH